MKDYDEMAKSVLKRRDKYVVERRRQMKKMASILSCFCLVALMGVGVWHSGTLSNQKEIVVDGGEVDTSDEEAAAGDGMPDGADGSDDSTDYAKEEMQVAGMADFGGNLDGDPAGYLPMISTFGETKMDINISVNNGGVLFSDALTGAMEKYGGDVKYRVIVELFSDGVAIDCASGEGKAEIERFADQGYIVAFENYNDGYVDHNYFTFTLHATLEQLESFPVSERYGYCVMLYGERIETDGELQDVFNETDNTPSVTDDGPVQDGGTGALNALDAVWGGSYMDEDGHWVVWLTENTKENQQKVFEQNPDLSESTTTFKTADYSLAYLTQLMADISEGMGDGKLPYVTSAALMEQDNRVAVRITVDDADTVALIQRFDTIGGAIEIQYTTAAGIDDLVIAK
jgi:hypothetical protein